MQSSRSPSTSDASLAALATSPAFSSFTYPFAPNVTAPSAGGISAYSSVSHFPSLSSLASSVALPPTRGFPTHVSNGVNDFAASPHPLPPGVVIRILAYAADDAQALCELGLV